MKTLPQAVIAIELDPPIPTIERARLSEVFNIVLREKKPIVSGNKDTAVINADGLGNNQQNILISFLTLLSKSTGCTLRINGDSDHGTLTLTLIAYSLEAAETLNNSLLDLAAKANGQTFNALHRQLELLDTYSFTSPHFEFTADGHLMFGIRATYHDTVPLEFRTADIRTPRSQSVRVEGKDVIAIGSYGMNYAAQILAVSASLPAKDTPKTPNITIGDHQGLFALAQEGGFLDRRARNRAPTPKAGAAVEPVR